MGAVTRAIAMRAAIAAAVVASAMLTVISPSLANTNRPPQIAGVPPTQAEVRTYYSFRPWAMDYEGKKLRFSVANKPAWAKFDTTVGRLSGTPKSMGRWDNIRISVSDGQNSVSLAKFSIVVSPSNASRAVTLSWLSPLSSADGSVGESIAGYFIHYGTAANALYGSIAVTNPSVTTYVVDDLPPATYYFAIRAVTASGQHSRLSNVITGTIRQ
jgi:hypothetical protein